MAIKGKLSEKFAAMPPKKRMIVAGGAVFVILAVAAILMGPSNPKRAGTKILKDSEQTSFAMAGGGGKDLSFERLAAQVDAGKQDLEREKEKSKRFEESVSSAARNPSPGSAETLAELKRIKDDLENVKRDQQKKPSLDDELPPTQAGNSGSGFSTAPQVIQEPEPPKIRIIGGAPKVNKDEQEEEKVPIVFLPGGSNFEGILMNGMDAPTSAVTIKNPVPALIRIKTDAILPNRHRYDVRECFVIVSGFGVLSTERAQLQLVSLSCVKTDGSVIETKMDGYVVGEDGKVGMRGRLVTKQGQIIAKSLLAGFASGFGAAMAPQTVPQLNIAPGSTSQYQMPDLGNAAMSGAAQGVSSSARAISQFYLDMAKEMFPVVEIDAARRVTIILTKGVELNVNGVSK